MLFQCIQSLNKKINISSFVAMLWWSILVFQPVHWLLCLFNPNYVYVIYGSSMDNLCRTLFISWGIIFVIRRHRLDSWEALSTEIKGKETHIYSVGTLKDTEVMKRWWEIINYLSVYKRWSWLVYKSEARKYLYVNK